MPREEIKKLATHSGKFHADECMAVAIITTIFNVITIVRTRDQNKYSDADIVVDVGGVFDREQRRFDHHQECVITIRDICSIHDNVQLSSCGMVYGVYGEKAIAEILKLPLDDQVVRKVFEKVYFSLIQILCEKDNGVFQRPSADKPRLNTRVQDLNNVYRAPEARHQDQRFLEAVEICSDTFRMEVRLQKSLLRVNSEKSPDKIADIPGNIECWPTDKPIKDFRKSIRLSKSIVPREIITACIILNTNQYGDYQVFMSDDARSDDQNSGVVISGIGCNDEETNDHKKKLSAFMTLKCAGETCATYLRELIESAILHIAPQSNPSDDEKNEILLSIDAEFFVYFATSSGDRKFCSWKDTHLVRRMEQLNNTALWEPGTPNFGPKKAFEMAMKEMMDVINSNVYHRLIGYPMVLQAVEHREKVHNSGRIIELEEGLRYNYLLKQIEERLKLESQILFVILPPAEDIGYSLYCVESKIKKKPRFPIKRYNMSVKDIPFIHGRGIFANGTTRDSVLQLAIQNVLERASNEPSGSKQVQTTIRHDL